MSLSDQSDHERLSPQELVLKIKEALKSPREETWHEDAWAVAETMATLEDNGMSAEQISKESGFPIGMTNQYVQAYQKYGHLPVAERPPLDPIFR